MQKELREKIHFLTLLPDAIYNSLDFEEFASSDEETEKYRQELETRLGAYIMTYKSEGIALSHPKENQLCSRIRCAKLDTIQVNMLKAAEEKTKRKGISLAAYAKPLEYYQLI